MSAKPRTPLVELRRLTKEYNVGQPTEVQVLHGLDLRIEQGEFAALIGPSGSGKSTLLNVLGLLERASGGEYLLQGRAVQQLPDDDLTRLRREVLGFVFQFHHLLPAFTALENVSLPVLMRDGHVAKPHLARARELLDAVGLSAAMDRKPAQLSGGMQQRVAIARALMLQPALVLADEPTGNLDTHRSQEIMELLWHLNAEQGITVLMVTHEPDMAQYARRIVRFVDGVVDSDAANPHPKGLDADAALALPAVAGSDAGDH